MRLGQVVGGDDRPSEAAPVLIDLLDAAEHARLDADR